jgi:RHS repeat-associated protein
VYDGPNVVLDLDAATLEPVSAYVHGLGIDQPIERIQFISGVADGRHVYHTDALGSVWAMTDDLQIVAQAYTYEAFGKLRAESGTGLLFPNRYTYTAREALGDSGALYYYRWRVMDPNVGRFTSEDPLGFVQGPNTYAYVRNMPVDKTDALGLQFYEPPLDSDEGSAWDLPIGIGIGIGHGAWFKIKGDINDKYWHCVTSCRIAKVSGEAVAEALGSVKEWLDEQFTAEGRSREDECANKTGRDLAKQGKDCPKGCQDAGYAPRK